MGRGVGGGLRACSLASSVSDEISLDMEARAGLESASFWAASALASAASAAASAAAASTAAVLAAVSRPVAVAAASVAAVMASVEVACCSLLWKEASCAALTVALAARLACCSAPLAAAAIWRADSAAGERNFCEASGRPPAHVHLAGGQKPARQFSSHHVSALTSPAKLTHSLARAAGAAGLWCAP